MRKPILFFIFIFLVVATSIAQKGKIFGVLQDTVSGQIISGAQIIVYGQQKTSDEKGYFEFTGLPYGDMVIFIELEGYEKTSIKALISESNPAYDAGIVKIKHSALQELDNSEATISVQDLEDENKTQNISGPLHSANDVFVSGVSFTLGTGGFRIRGFDSENSMVYINGASVNNAETGRAKWSEWGGLNDAVRIKTTVSGLVPAEFSFGDIGGATNIDMRPSKQRKQIKVSYALSNKTYTHRTMATYSSGLMDNGWAIFITASRRWGNGGFVEGTFYDAWSYLMGVEKKLNNKHSLAITCFAAPTTRGMQSSSVQEANDLAETNFYNPNWGFQNGELRNAKVSTMHEPYLIFNHYWAVNPKFKINTAISYTFGKNGSTSLNWYNAADPRPDYYRYLPSYQTDPLIATDVANQWKNDVNTRQVNWDKLYQINYLSNLSGEQAHYVIEERRNDYKQFNYSSHTNYELSDKLKLSGGVEYKNFTGEHYKTLSDLLGGNYWVDVDQFAERDFQSDTNKLQNDLNNPNRVIKVGDKFGYDYVAHINSESGWAQAEVTTAQLDYYAAASIVGTQFWRQGNMKNGRYPDESYGSSPKQNFINFGVKGGITYKLNGRHFIIASTGYITQAPLYKNAYISPRIRETLVPDLKSERIFNAEMSYIVRYPKIKGRLSVYQSMFWDQNEINSFYHDVYRTYVNHVMTGINKTHQGIEAALEVKATSTISVTGIAALGNYRYTSRPKALISVDNGSVADVTNDIYIKNFYVSGTPQSAASLGIKYSHPKYWFANLNFNYFDIVYMDFNPERRTTTAVDGLLPGDSRIAGIIEQSHSKSQFTIDVSLSKSIKIKDYFININCNVNNILDNQNLITNGYEQMRFDFETKNINKFPPKYFYGFGRTYYFGVSFRF